ncbi:hypothetical protein NDU88_009492 [Pleurodeles waltl]|uniref:Uncharacterized protein n=1 Tax=Pleurodeles waltl TaxID=8319 RepID=A0AAV7PW34_PLEWA|nr:hypothetical protein NDU88_009492 [Pleurodeles waltl]
MKDLEESGERAGYGPPAALGPGGAPAAAIPSLDTHTTLLKADPRGQRGLSSRPLSLRGPPLPPHLARSLRLPAAPSPLCGRLRALGWSMENSGGQSPAARASRKQLEGDHSCCWWVREKAACMSVCLAVSDPAYALSPSTHTG